MRSIIVFLVISLVPSISWAACSTPCTLSGTTWTCTDISRDCVQAAVDESEASWNAANEIKLAGGQSATWNDSGGPQCVGTSTSCLCMKRGVKLTGGNGGGETVITVTGTCSYGAIVYNASATAVSGNESLEINYLTIDGANAYHAEGKLAIRNYGTTAINQVKLHHLTFQNSGFNTTSLMFDGPIYGVVYQNTFRDASIWFRAMGGNERSWNLNQREYGTVNTLVIEDNNITATGERYTMRLDVAPGTAWSVNDTITGASSGVTCTVKAIDPASTLRYYTTKPSGTYTRGETLSNGTYTADQGLGYPDVGSTVGYFMVGQGAPGVAVRYNTINSLHNTDKQLLDLHGLQSMTTVDTDACVVRNCGDGGASDPCYASRRCCTEWSQVKTEIYGNIYTNLNAAYGYSYWVVDRGSWLLMYNNLGIGSYAGGSTPHPAIAQYSCDSCQSTESTNDYRYSQRVQNTYTFNNTYNGVDQPNVVVDDRCNDHADAPYTITENREFFNYSAGCTGSSCSAGIGCGASAPTGTCSTGVAYWVTSVSPCTTPPSTIADMKTYNQAGTLYKCTSTDTWEAYYTPYTYPHPLRGIPTASTSHASGSFNLR